MVTKKQQRKPGFIFSVHQDGLNEEINKINHEKVKSMLSSRRIRHKEVDGVYTYANGKKAKEMSFYVETSERINLSDLNDLVEVECYQADQESYLALTSDRQASLVYMDKKTPAINLGKLQAVNEYEAKNNEAYTYCPKLDAYFICK